MAQQQFLTPSPPSQYFGWEWGGKQALGEQTREFNEKMGLYRQMLDLYGKQSTGLTGLINQYYTAFNQARAENEARRTQQLGLIGTTTGQREADIRADYARQGASAMQRLARLGMSNTSVASTQQIGLQREQQSALNRLADEMLQQKLSVVGKEYKYPEPGITEATIQAFAPRYPTFSF